MILVQQDVDYYISKTGSNWINTQSTGCQTPRQVHKRTDCIYSWNEKGLHAFINRQQLNEKNSRGDTRERRKERKEERKRERKVPLCMAD
ncbi:hypothetical protein ACE6H2_026247 [Prunus campanulata]